MVLSLAQMSLSGALIIAVVIVLRCLCLHRLPKKMFFALWVICLLCLLLPVRVPAPVSIYQFLENAPGAAGSSFAVSESTNSAAKDGPDATYSTVQDMDDSMVSAGDSGAGSNMALSGDNSSAQDVAGSASDASSSMGSGPWTLINLWTLRNLCTFRNLCMIIWLAGLLSVAAVIVSGHIRGRRKYQMALPVHLLPEGFGAVFPWMAAHPLRRKVQVRYSDQIDTPLTYGILRPVILLPKGMDWLDTRRVAFVLAHEMAHIRRFDSLTKWLLTAALCIHWFNPLVWAMYVLMNRDMELSCDEAVLKKYGGDSRAEYAMALVGMEERRHSFAPMANCFCKNALRERITSIMKSRPASRAKTVLAAVLVLAVACGFATAASKDTDQVSESLAQASNVQDQLSKSPDQASELAYESGLAMKVVTDQEMTYTQEQYDMMVSELYIEDYEAMSIAEFNRTIYKRISENIALQSFVEEYAWDLPENDPYREYLLVTVYASVNEYESRLDEVYSRGERNPEVYRHFQKEITREVFGEPVVVGGYDVEYAFSYRILDEEKLTVGERDAFLKTIASRMEARSASEAGSPGTPAASAADGQDVQAASGAGGLEEALADTLTAVGTEVSNEKITFVHGWIEYADGI